jgi:hypothetical protein
MCDPVTMTSCMPPSLLPASDVDASAGAAGPSAALAAAGAAGAASLLASRVAGFCGDFAALSATGADRDCDALCAGEEGFVSAVSVYGALDCANAGALPSAGPRRSNEVMAADALLRAETGVRSEAVRS